MAGIQGMILSIVLWRHKSNRIQNNLLAWLVMMFSLSLLLYIATYTKAIYFHPLYPGVIAGWILGTAGANCLLMYVRACFGIPPRPPKAWLYWLPSVFFIGLVGAYYMTERRTGETFSNIGWLGLGYMVAITMLSYYKYRQYASLGTAGLRSQRTKRYLQLLLLFFAVYSVVQIAGFALYYFIPFVISLYVSVLVKLLTTIGIYAIAYLNVQYAHHVAPVYIAMPSAGQAEKYKFSSLDEETARHINTQLLKLVEAEKIYLQRDLKLKDVADKLGTSVHHLSQVLNERIGMSFPDFVNKLRIEEAQRLLAAGDDSKIESIALDTGFNNKVSFNKAFKKFTGLTPSQFKMQAQEARSLDTGLPQV